MKNFLLVTDDNDIRNLFFWLKFFNFPKFNFFVGWGALVEFPFRGCFHDLIITALFATATTHYFQCSCWIGLWSHNCGWQTWLALWSWITSIAKFTGPGPLYSRKGFFLIELLSFLVIEDEPRVIKCVISFPIVSVASFKSRKNKLVIKLLISNKTK